MNATDTTGDGRSLVDVVSYDVRVDLRGVGETFRSRTEVSFDCAQPGATVQADLAAERVERVVLNGVDLDPGTAWKGERLALAHLAGTNRIRVDAEFAYAPRRTGLYRPAGAGCAYSGPFPLRASEVFCCLGRPDLPAAFTGSVQVPRGWSAVGAGMGAVARVAPITAVFCAGRFERQSFGVDAGRVEVGLVARPWFADAVARLPLPSLVRGVLGWYENALRVPFPYRACDLVFVPGYPALASSLPGVVVVQESVLRRQDEPGYLATVVAHELAHAWTSGLARAGYPGDAAFLEAVTTYLGRTALADLLPGFQPWAEQVSRTLPDHGYAAHAQPVRDLALRLGPDVLHACLRENLRRNDAGSMPLDDAVACWSDVCGVDLTPWLAGVRRAVTRR